MRPQTVLVARGDNWNADDLTNWLVSGGLRAGRCCIDQGVRLTSAFRRPA